MEKDNRQIFLVGSPRVVMPEQRPLPVFCFGVVLTALACAASFGCFYTAFDIAVRPVPVVLLGALFALIAVGNAMLPKHRGAVSLALWAVWGLLVYWQFPALYQGFVATANTVIYVYADCLDTVLPLFALPAGFSASAGNTVTLLAVFLLFPVAKLYGWLLARRTSTLGAFCVSGLFLLASLLISVLPAVWALGMMLVFWMFLLLASPSLGKRRLYSDESGRIQISGRAFVSPVTLLLLPALAVSLLALYRICTPFRPNAVNDLRTTVTQSMNIPAMLKGGTGNGNSQVDLNSLGDRVYSGKTVLRVKYEFNVALSDYEFQKDYLKSFTGSVYTGQSWEKLDNGQANAVNDILGEVKAQRLPHLLGSQLPCRWDSDVSYRLTVEKVNADSRCIYVPYGLNTLSPEGDWVADSFIKSGSFFAGPASYELSASVLPRSEPANLLERLSEWSGQDPDGSYTLSSGDITQDESNGTITIKSSSAPLSTLTDDLFSSWEQAGDEFNPEQYRLPDTTLDGLPLTEEQRELVDRAQDYAEFVYDTYTQLPEDTAAFAKEYLASHGLPTSPQPYVEQTATGSDGTSDGAVSHINNGYYDAAGAIKELLNAECEYSLSPAEPTGEEDFVEFFLNESKEGFCVHFATAEVVLLRAMGIPARYAEGYAVPVDKSGGWVTVTDRSSHAWVEIYFNGVGWLPFEATPAGPDAPAACENGIAPTDQDDPSLDMSIMEPDPQPTRTPREPASTPAARATPQPLERKTWATPRPAAAQTEDSEDHTLLVVLLSAAGALLAVFPLMWLVRKLRILFRKLSFRQRDKNRAALKIYSHLLRLYQVDYILPNGVTEPPEDIEELALKARFSQHAITREEIQKLLSHAAELEKRLDKELATRPRLRCKYLLALF